MVFRMKHKRVYYGKLPLRTGWKNISLRTPDLATARAKQRMLDGFRHQRRWAILDAIREKRLTVDQVYDAHQAEAMDQLLVRATDENLALRIPGWQRRLAGRVGDQSRDAYLAQVLTLVGERFMRSESTTERLAGWLDSLEVGNDTKRKYYAAARSFFGYLVTLKVLERSPLVDFAPPKAGKPRVHWLRQSDMQRVVDASYEPYRSFFALLYGTGIEVTVAAGLTRRAVNPDTREIFAPGTKTHCRERIVRVSEWAWPYLAELCQGKLPDALLFPGMNRAKAFYQHTQVVKRLGLAGYQVRDSRHSWAVRAAKAGTPPEIIARQLGHADASMVHRIYGRFMPSQHDRDKWERIAALQDEAERAKK